MMDEATALTKWCPLVRFKSAETGSGPAFNRQRVSSDLDDVNCIGSKCAAWQWWREDKVTLVGSGPLETHEPGKGPESMTHGYCGAFGGQS